MATRTPTRTPTTTPTRTPTATSTLPFDCETGEFQVNTTTNDDQYDPDVDKADDGRFVVVWTDRNGDGDGYGIFGQRYNSDASQAGSEFQVNTYQATVGYQREPAVALHSDGDFVVVWSSTQGEYVDPNDPNAPSAGSGIFGQRFTSAGAPFGSDFVVNSTTAYSQIEPDVAADSVGGFVVVWRDTSSYYAAIKGQRFASNGETNGTEFVVNTFTDSYKTSPAVASDAIGNFVVVWDSFGGEGGYPQDGDSGAVIGRRYNSSGSPADDEFIVNTTTVNSQDSPDVGMAANGAFVVVWQSYGQDGSGEGVFAQRYDSDGSTAGTEFRVNTVTNYDQYRARVAVEPGGDFVVVWQSYGQDSLLTGGIFGKRYSSAGVPIGTEFQVNTYTTGRQSYPAVAADTGNFVVVWEDGGGYSIGEQPPDPARGGGAGGPEPEDGQDGSQIGIFGKQFVVFDVCGNGIVELLESCDDGGESALCDSDCTEATCGDGTINEAAGEQCEPPNVGFCNSDCQSTF
jgi:hypothetical protein